MLDWIKRETVWTSSPESIASGKVSALAIVEVILSVIAYWWIAAALETHLHILVSLFAAPLVLLRSTPSISRAKKSWLEYTERELEPNIFSRTTTMSAIITTSALISFYFSKDIIDISLSPPTPESLELIKTSIPLKIDPEISRQYFLMLFAFLGLTLASHHLTLFFIDTLIGYLDGINQKSSGRRFAIKSTEIGSSLGIFTASFYESQKTLPLSIAIPLSLTLSTLAIVYARIIHMQHAFATGLWFRAFIIRLVSVLTNIKSGVISAPENWTNTLLIEDSHSPIELIPGIETKFDTLTLNSIRTNKNENEQIGTDEYFYLNVIAYLKVITSLAWRYSIKSTFWFYAPVFLISRKSELANTVVRSLHFDAKPSLWFTLRFTVALLGLFAAMFATVNWAAAWQFHVNDAPFSPVGWLLVLDWDKFAEQPWQWFTLPAAALTVLIYFWLDSLRKLRDSAIAHGKDPEQIASIEHHPGLTIYWLDRLRNALVIISLIVGLWCFTEWAYFNGTIALLEPYLIGVFGPKT